MGGAFSEAIVRGTLQPSRSRRPAPVLNCEFGESARLCRLGSQNWWLLSRMPSEWILFALERIALTRRHSRA